ncbi:Hypothetical protein, putative [Bodo saltans]|uniref:Uncharacterized protein n=1 Tax=Bodo saltans TaxID=75058 RepID=A0A0S4J4M7_BODSA|nr:Hypothetical protein, putative [Bodo saltans]|eukprot:CUG77465.1 Hypothetical protein, putative [Bodo saltans]
MSEGSLRWCLTPTTLLYRGSNSHNNTSPPPIPFLSFEEIRADVVRPNDLIDVLTFVRRLRCPRLETWELEKRERDRHASSQQRRLDDVTAPSAEDQRVSRIVVQKLTQDRAATKRVASSPPKKARNGNTSHQLPLGDTAPPPTAQQRGTRAQRLANLLDDNDEDDEQRPPQQPRSHQTSKAQTSDTLSQDAVSDSVLAAIRAYGARTTTHQHNTAGSSYHSMEDKTDDVAAAELLSTSSSRYSHRGLASSSRHPQRHADPSIGIQHHMLRGEPHEQSFQRRTTSDTAKTVEMMLSSNVSATHDEDDVVDSPPPQLPIPLPVDGSRRPRQQAQVNHTMQLHKDHPPPHSDHSKVISATVPPVQQQPKASRHKSTGFMSPTSSTLARREAAAIERRQAEQATREEKESERHAWSSTTPRSARVTAAARPRPSPPRTPPVTQTSKIATVAEVRKQTTSASPKRTRRSSPPALGGEVRLSTIGREGLMMVWQELKSQKSTLEALTSASLNDWA